MLDQIKKIAELKKLQDSFKKENVTVEKRRVSVTMNGNFEVENITLSPELNLEDQQNTLKECLNEVREQIQKTMAQKLMASGITF